MTINDILKLEIKKGNIKKVESFISKAEKDGPDYYLAYSFKAYMYYKLGDVSSAITLLISGINEAKNKNAKVEYADKLIEIYLDLEEYDKAFKYIEQKEENLSPLEMQKHTKDLIMYYAKRRDTKKAKEEIDKYLNDDITEEDKLFVLRLLLNYAYEDNNLEDFFESFPTLEKNYRDLNKLGDLETIYLYKLNLLFNNLKKDEALSFAKSLDLSQMSAETRVAFYIVILKIYISNGKLRQAAIFDSENEAIVSQISDVSLKKEYYTVTLSLYKSFQSQFNVGYIENKLKELSESKEEKEVVRSKFNNLPNVVIERVVEHEKREEDEKSLEYTTSDIASINVSDKYKKLNEILEVASKIDSTISFREALRQLLVSFRKAYSFEELIFYIDLDKSGYHFKSDRLYDKDFSNLDLSKSITKRTYDLDKEVILSNLAESYYNLDIIKGEETSFKSCISFPFYYDNLKIGAITFFFSSSLENNNDFEFFKFLTKIINVMYNSFHKANLVLKSDETLKILEKKMPIGIKTISLNNIIINDRCKELLEISENEMLPSDYLMLLPLDSQIVYKDAIQKLLFEDINELDIKYNTINNKYLNEHFLKGEGNIILSFVEDITESKNTNDRLLEYAYSDSFTKALSFKAFKTDSELLFKEHDKSIVLVDSNEFDMYSNLYGYEFKNQMIYSIGKFFDENKEENYKLYHLDSSRFILVYNNNDKRTLKKKVLKLLDSLSYYLNQINKRVNITFFAGIFRQSAKDRTLNVSDMLNFATESLLSGYFLNERIVVYDEDIYSNKFFLDYEAELELSEAFDKDRLKSLYKAVYDIDKQNVLGYFYSFSKDNLLISEKTFDTLVYKRGLEYKVDKYKIRHALEDLKNFYNKTGYYINLFIPIYAKSIENPTFIAYLKKEFNFYKISSKFISFKIIGSIHSIESLNLIKEGEINLGISTLDDLFKYDFDTIYLDFNSFKYEDLLNIKNILNNKRLILSNVESNEEVNKAKKITRYITGNKIIRVKDIENLINEALNKE